MDGFYIYKYVSSDGRIVYIGKSETVLQRIKQHGREEKFKKYPDAEIYIHQCASRHEMDALEIILIEKHKPELNITSKTDNALSFDFDAEIEWVKVKDISPERKAAAVALKKENGIVIKSSVTENKFINAVWDWHELYYFINWLKDQSDDDSRGTIEFNLFNHKETSKWIWKFDNKGSMDNVNQCCGVVLPVTEGMALAVGSCRQKDRIWIDLYYPVNVLKRIIPMLLIDLDKRKKKIEKYTGIGESFAASCKSDGFYGFFERVRFNTVWPDIKTTISHDVCEVTLKNIRDNNISPAQHTSPRINASDMTKEEVKNVFLSMFTPKTYYCRVGGAYWNVWGIAREEVNT